MDKEEKREYCSMITDLLASNGISLEAFIRFTIEDYSEENSVPTNKVLELVYKQLKTKFKEGK